MLSVNNRKKSATRKWMPLFFLRGPPGKPVRTHSRCPTVCEETARFSPRQQIYTHSRTLELFRPISGYFDLFRLVSTCFDIPIINMLANPIKSSINHSARFVHPSSNPFTRGSGSSLARVPAKSGLTPDCSGLFPGYSGLQGAARGYKHRGGHGISSPNLHLDLSESLNNPTEIRLNPAKIRLNPAIFFSGGR